MTVTIKEWVQDQWTTPNVPFFSRTGDYFSLQGLTPTPNRRQLQRTPGWSAQVVTDTNNLAAVEGMFFDHANTRYVLIGGDGGTNLISAYLDSSWSLSADTTLHATPTALGGLSCRNVVWWGGQLWLIGSDGKVYKGSAYTAALAEFDASTTHVIIVNMDDRLWAAHSDGQIDRSSSDASTLSWYLDAAGGNITPNPVYLASYRGYVLLITRHPQGTLEFYRINRNAADRYDHIFTLPSTGTHPTYGCLFQHYDSHIYLSPGFHVNADGSLSLHVYRYTGAQVQYLTTIQHSPNTGGSGVPASAGFVTWRNHLVYYALEGTVQQFKILTDGHFTDLPSLTATAMAKSICANLGGQLITVADDTTEGIHHLGSGSRYDGHVVTSRLHMDHPGKDKLLHRLTVLMDGTEASFQVLIKYRVNDNTAWTTAVTTANSRRITVDLAVAFYTLQIRVDIDDNSGNNADYRIAAISALYTVDT